MLEQELRQRAERRDARLYGRTSLTDLMRNSAVEIEKLRDQNKEMAAIIRHFMSAPPDELVVRSQVSFETAELIYGR